MVSSVLLRRLVELNLLPTLCASSRKTFPLSLLFRMSLLIRASSAPKREFFVAGCLPACDGSSLYRQACSSDASSGSSVQLYCN